MFRLLLILLVLCLALPAHAEDAWARDKSLHFGLSIMLGAGGYGGAALITHPRWARAALGAGFALGVGGAKELWDLRHGDPSLRDFGWDVAGSAVGVGLAYLLDLALSRPLRAREPVVRTARAGPWR